MTTEQLENEIILSMSTILDNTQLQYLRNVLSSKMKDVKIECTDLAIYDNANKHYLDLFLACKSLEGLSPLTIKQYRNGVLRFISTQRVDLIRCTADHVRNYLAYLATQGNSKVSVNNQRSYLSSFFKWMWDEGYIERNIVSQIKKVKQEKRQPQLIDNIDVAKVKRACVTEREVAFIDLLMSTGMRCSEICGLKLGDISFENKTILIHGKGSKDRIGFMTPSLQLSLTAYLNGRGYDSEYVFGRLNGDHGRISSTAMQNMLNHITKRAGTGHIVIHKFRHFFCTELCRRGMSIQEVQVLMGHSSIETTAKVYNHVKATSIANDFTKFCA